MAIKNHTRQPTGSSRAFAVVEGRNGASASWATLTDPQGNDLNITTAKLEMVAEATLEIRPRVVGGDGTTSLTAHLLCKE